MLILCLWLSPARTATSTRALGRCGFVGSWQEVKDHVCAYDEEPPTRAPHKAKLNRAGSSGKSNGSGVEGGGGHKGRGEQEAPQSPPMRSILKRNKSDDTLHTGASGSVGREQCVMRR